MPNIKPVSDLRNYNDVLNIREYEKTQATNKLLSKLMEAERVVKSGEEWLTEQQVRESLEL